jgi:hypothetical protein
LLIKGYIFLFLEFLILGIFLSWIGINDLDYITKVNTGVGPLIALFQSAYSKDLELINNNKSQTARLLGYKSYQALTYDIEKFRIFID